MMMTQAVAPDDPFGMIDPVAYWGGVQPNRLAIGDFSSGRKLSYSEFDRRIDRCAGLLEHALGDPVGERVAVLTRNSLDFLTLHFAAIRIGAIFVPLNWRLSAPEISVLVQDCSPRLLCVEDEFRPVIDALTGGHSIERILDLEPKPFQALLDAAPAKPSRPRPNRSDQPSTLLYTSGTTGRPKGVMVSERGAFASNVNFAFSTRLGASSVMMCDMPLFHVAGLMAGARAAGSETMTPLGRPVVPEV